MLPGRRGSALQLVGLHSHLSIIILQSTSPTRLWIFVTSPQFGTNTKLLITTPL